jgi:hypothetical protein
MAISGTTGMRIRGAVILLFAVPVLALGFWLMHVVQARPLPEWLPQAWRAVPHLNLPAEMTPAQRWSSAPGVGSLFLLAFGMISGVQGALMVILGRRSLVLLAAMAMFLLVLIGSGLWYH